LRTECSSPLQWPGPDGRRPSSIAERAGVSKQAVNHVLRDLERLGYVRLVADADDRRARVVRLTERGRGLADALFAAALETERDLLASLPAQRRLALRADLTALLRAEV
jgi:DNA-binding MarR family transcriptional regulator